MARFVAIALAALSLGACVPSVRGPVDLRDAEVKEIRFQLRHARAAICPGERVPLDVAMDVRIDGETQTVRQRRDEIDEPIFSLDQLYLESPQGHFEDGAFIPNADARASLGTGFVFYARAPRGPAFSIRFPPYYECGGEIGGTGIAGMPGNDFSEPNAHNARRGSDAIEGRMTAESIDGVNGGKGPKLTVFVTWVQTADYTKLLAGHAEGDLDMVTLVAPGYPLNVIARGGAGGDGGKGSKGGIGGSRGGIGGAGGVGGQGGDVEVVLDERFPDLSGLVNVDVRGGAGGLQGPGGSGGDREILLRHTKKGYDMGYVPVGKAGLPGFAGVPGVRGADGTFSIRRGEVRDHFAGVAGLTTL